MVDRACAGQSEPGFSASRSHQGSYAFPESTLFAIVPAEQSKVVGWLLMPVLCSWDLSPQRKGMQ